MKVAALVLLTGCAQIFGLSSPKPSDGGGSNDSAVSDAGTDALDAHFDLPDAAPGHCVTIADCPTSVCLPSTMCAADTDVAWLSATGTLNISCTMAMPCSALSSALNTGRPYVRVQGAISQLATISRNVSIFAEPGGAFTNSNLSINNGNVGLYELELASSCVLLNAGTLMAEHIYLHDCTGIGISANGALTLDGSRIQKNRSGGVDVAAGPTFSITNNVIVGNGLSGGGGGGVGGIRLESTAIAANSKVDFNTIVGNNVKSTSSAGGLYCNSSGFTATGNVLAANLFNTSPTAANSNTLGACTIASSVVQASANLGFVNVATFDFHITASSPLRDAATVAIGPATDLDGESRPYGPAYDIGADEYHP